MTSATAEAWPEPADGFTRLRLRFRAWRRTRPFWGGLLAMIAGVPILYFPYAHLTLGGLTVAMSTTAGAGSLIIGLLMMVLGVSAWFQPLVRVFCGVGVTILALISIPVSNLGGFLMGLILGLVAGGLLCSWAPLKEPAIVAASEPGTAAEAPVALTVATEEDPVGYQVVPYQAESPEAAPAQFEETGPTPQQGDLR
ncbi:DUF6114 domain-containing protein [Kitasatospora mediocidica]|uniref:DUF6114 domain-containing protein n=1 Tax=Kitasatospora mediocidica TaxID=58352 RepID=UPI00056440A4|nr:DUF6114 domain-containing protein [Kitasatospora mediocidica]